MRKNGAISPLGTTLTLVVLLAVCVELHAEQCRDALWCPKSSGSCLDSGRRGETVKKNCRVLCGTCPSSKFVSRSRVKSRARSRASVRSRSQQSQKAVCVDHQHCKYWNRNGFCDSSRDDSEKAFYCPNECNRCNKNSPSNPNPSNPRSNPSKRKPTKTKTTTTTTTTPAPARSSPSEVPYDIFLHSLDESVDPCDDFYKFSCGKYQAENPPQNGESFSRVIDHTRMVEKQLKKALFSNDTMPSTAVGLMRQFRDACMDTTTIETDLTTALRRDLTSMGGIPMLLGAAGRGAWIPTTFNITATLIQLNRLSGHNYLFNIELAPDNSFIFSPSDLIIKSPDDYSNPRMTRKVDALKTFLAQIITTIGTDMGSTETFAAIKTAIDAVVALEQQLAQEYVTENIDDPTTMQATLAAPKRLADFATLLQNPRPALQVDLVNYLTNNVLLVDPQIKALVATNPQVYIHNEALFRRIMPILMASERVLADYLFIHYVLRQVNYLDSRFAASAQRFATQIDGSTYRSTRDQDCFDMVRANFPLALDHVYVNKFLNPRAQTSASAIMDKMREGFGDVIRSASWLEAVDQQYAIKKLGATKEVVGAMEEAQQRKKLDAIYASVRFTRRDNFMDMAKKVSTGKGRVKYAPMVRANSFIYDKSMASDNVGTNFINEQNQLFIPAAVLQEPFLDTTLPPSVTYGALGFLYGYGLEHGFDDTGSNFDLNGVQRPWWSGQSKTRFDKKKQCLVSEYSNEVEPLTGRNVDGGKTLAENVADSGAIRAAFQAYRAYMAGPNQGADHVPGYGKYTNDQTFFMGYATSMCASLDRTFQDELLNTDAHAPNQFRVNTLLRNYPEFAKAFKCPAGAKMMAQQPCSVW